MEERQSNMKRYNAKLATASQKELIASSCRTTLERLYETHGVRGECKQFNFSPSCLLTHIHPSLLHYVLMSPCFWVGSAASRQQLGKTESLWVQSSEGKGTGWYCK